MNAIRLKPLLITFAILVNACGTAAPTIAPVPTTTALPPGTQIPTETPPLTPTNTPTPTPIPGTPITQVKDLQGYCSRPRGTGQEFLRFNDNGSWDYIPSKAALDSGSVENVTAFTASPGSDGFLITIHDVSGPGCKDTEMGKYRLLATTARIVFFVIDEPCTARGSGLQGSWDRFVPTP